MQVLLTHIIKEMHETVIHLTSNKFYTYSLNVEPINSVVLRMYESDFDNITITFPDQN